MTWEKKLLNLFADLGDLLAEKVRDKDTAIIVGILCLLAPLGFIFAISFIASIYRKKKKK